MLTTSNICLTRAAGCANVGTDGRVATSEAREDLAFSGTACGGWGAASQRAGGRGGGGPEELSDGAPPPEKAGGRRLRDAGERGADGPAHGERMGGCREDGVAGQDRRRARAGGRGDGRGLLAGGGAPRVAFGEAPVSVAGGGAEHGGGQDRGRGSAGRGGGREPVGRFHSCGVAQGRRGGDGAGTRSLRFASPREEAAGRKPDVSQLPSMGYGLMPYLALACVSAVVGYYFARKRTEYEVGYSHRVEVYEGVQGMVIPLVEEFEAALQYVRAPGPSGDLPLEDIENAVDGLEKYVAQHEMWLDRRTSAAVGDLISAFRARLRALELLPGRYDDPGFERAYERTASDLEGWLGTGLPAAREDLDEAFRAMLGVGRWRRLL